MIDLDKFLDKYYQKDDKIILGCSAGPDSIFLLYKILETKYAKNLVVAYFNHKTRPETDQEEAYLENLSKEKGFIFEVASCDFEKIKKLYPSKSFEELAREKRYQFFDALMNIHKSKNVITGHHLDDKIETFFFNLVRGSKITGLVNMTESSGGVLRPLLNIEKNEIIEYLNSNNLRYFTDSTNYNTQITRNKLRQDIIPQFGEINSNYKNNLNNLICYLEELKESLDQEVISFLGEESEFNISEFNSLSKFKQKEIIRYVYYTSNNKSTIGLSESNINEVLKFINDKGNKTKKEIRNMKLFKNNTKIEF